MSLPAAEIGIFGGSGLYELLDSAQEVTIDTPFGPTSDACMVGQMHNRSVVFMPRHGRNHSVPPGEINYRANVWAMKQLGVSQIIGPNSCGSLQHGIHPGDFVICDQFVDRTKGRADTFFTKDSGSAVTHISCAEPYCPTMRKVAVRACKELGITVHDGGTIVTIQGPRFSTKAESEWFTKMGWTCVNMTQYPECYLARELEICYCDISLITDYDSGLGVHEAVTNDQVLAVFNKNLDKLRDLLYAMVLELPHERTCACKDALGGASF